MWVIIWGLGFRGLEDVGHNMGIRVSGFKGFWAWCLSFYNGGFPKIKGIFLAFLP